MLGAQGTVHIPIYIFSHYILYILHAIKYILFSTKRISGSVVFVFSTKLLKEKQLLIEFFIHRDAPHLGRIDALW